MKFPFAQFIVEGRSMTPALQPGDRVVACRFLKGKVGDLIVFRQEARTMVKRISGIANQQYEVVGDNSGKSTDSQAFGSLKKSQIIGKVIARIPSSHKLQQKS